MFRHTFLAKIVACCLGFAVISPFPLMSAEPRLSAKKPFYGTDIILVKGTLTGKLLSANGSPVDGAAVTVTKQGKEVGKAITTADGTYTVDDLTTGPHLIRLVGAEVPVRLWSQEAAPTSAKPQLTISQPAVRGQAPGGLGGIGGIGGASMSTIVATVAAVGATSFAAVQVQQNAALQNQINQLQSP